MENPSHPDLDLATSALLFGVGLAAGFVNTVAGAGSALTLPALMAAGLDASVANASNRVAVTLQSLAAAVAFHRRGVRPWRAALPVLPALVLGAVGGALLATRVSPGGLQTVFGVLFLVLAALLGLRPGWLRPPGAAEGGPRPGAPSTQGLFLLTGLYGGFVQAGVGIPLLLLLVRRLGLDAVAGNAAKVLLILTFTAAALLVFEHGGRVDWPRGLVTAAGSLCGSLLGVEASLRLGANLIRRAVVAALLLAAARAFEVF